MMYSPVVTEVLISLFTDYRMMYRLGKVKDSDWFIATTPIEKSWHTRFLSLAKDKWEWDVLLESSPNQEEALETHLHWIANYADLVEKDEHTGFIGF